MFQSKQQTIYPKMIPKIRRHFSKVYLSAGPKYASDQDRFQSTLKESQVDFLRGVEPFEVVIIDSLNPFFQSIQDLFPATIYLIGQERDDITTNVSKTWTPGHVLPFSTDNPYFQELVKATHWHLRGLSGLHRQSLEEDDGSRTTSDAGRSKGDGTRAPHPGISSWGYYLDSPAV